MDSRNTSSRLGPGRPRARRIQETELIRVRGVAGSASLVHGRRGGWAGAGVRVACGAGYGLGGVGGVAVARRRSRGRARGVGLAGGGELRRADAGSDAEAWPGDGGAVLAGVLRFGS